MENRKENRGERKREVGRNMAIKRSPFKGFLDLNKAKRKAVRTNVEKNKNIHRHLDEHVCPFVRCQAGIVNRISPSQVFSTVYCISLMFFPSLQ